MAINKKPTLKSIADSERIRQVGLNDRNFASPYDLNEALKNKGGNANDKAERIKQLGKNDFNSGNQYGINNLDK